MQLIGDIFGIIKFDAIGKANYVIYSPKNTLKKEEDYFQNIIRFPILLVTSTPKHTDKRTYILK